MALRPFRLRECFLVSMNTTISRRSIAKGAAWAAPVVAVGAAAPTAAASTTPPPPPPPPSDARGGGCRLATTAMNSNNIVTEFRAGMVLDPNETPPAVNTPIVTYFDVILPAGVPLSQYAAPVPSTGSAFTVSLTTTSYLHAATNQWVITHKLTYTRTSALSTSTSRTCAVSLLRWTGTGSGFMPIGSTFVISSPAAGAGTYHLDHVAEFFV